MEKKEHYVYGLIDPRNQQYFYIGKGKGKRYLSHLKVNKWDFNLTKTKRIKEIISQGFEIKIEILFSNLEEFDAFDIERILIFKLGRSILAEGILTNMVPGGNWKKSESVLYEDSFKCNFDILKLKAEEQTKFLQFEKISTFDYLNTNNINVQNLSKYSSDGSLIKTETINSYLADGFSGNLIEIIKNVRENSKPIRFGSFIFSKFKAEKLYISEHIPYADFDIIDEQFNIDFDKLNESEANFEIETKVDGFVRLKVSKENGFVNLNSFYPNGNKKSFRQNKIEGIQNNSFDWYENGNLKISEIYPNGTFEQIRTTYFENGNKEIEISNLNKEKTYDRWFENGQKELELVKDIGYIYYNEKGEKIKTMPKE